MKTVGNIRLLPAALPMYGREPILGVVEGDDKALVPSHRDLVTSETADDLVARGMAEWVEDEFTPDPPPSGGGPLVSKTAPANPKSK